jgi:hypothetical protein
MKFIILGITILLFGCTNYSTQNTVSLKDIMAYGVITELNNQDENIEKELFIRLYQTPSDNSCLTEIHSVCQYQYHMSVSTFDEYPEANVFELAIRGEIINTTWLAVDSPDYAKIEVTYNKFTNEALKNDKSLINIVTTQTLRIDVKDINFTK